MNKSNNNELSAQTEADSNSTAENQQVSQPNANTNVVGSHFKSREIKFKYIFKTYDGRFFVEFFTLKELEYGGLQNFLFGLHDIIIVAKCQYTGLKDRKDKEIYEGDIIDYGHERFRPVEFIDGAFCILKIPSMSSLMTLYPVVGNVFENPELLQSVA